MLIDPKSHHRIQAVRRKACLWSGKCGPSFATAQIVDEGPSDHG